MELAALTAVLIAAGSSGGCSAPAEPQAGKSPATDQRAMESHPATSVTLRVIDEKEFARVLDRHRGKAVLVDFWATWCTECVARFPHTVALHRQWSPRGLVSISVSFDDPEDEAKALRFLQSQGAEFENFLSRYGAGTQSVESFRLDSGTLPYLQLFGRDGRLHKAFLAGRFTEKDLERAVQDLLEAQPGA